MLRFRRPARNVRAWLGMRRRGQGKGIGYHLIPHLAHGERAFQPEFRGLNLIPQSDTGCPKKRPDGSD